MMKRFTKLLSVLLVLAVCFSLSSPAFALGLPLITEPTVENSTELILSEQDGHTVSILGEDLSNGDIRFFLMDNSQVISCSYVNRSAEKIVYAQYENGAEVFSEEEYIQCIPQVQFSSPQLQSSNGYISVGKVGYAYYLQGFRLTNYIDWAYSTSVNFNSSCDLAGPYRDVADFAAYIVCVCALLTGAPALKIASAIFTYLGMNGSPTQFIIPPYPVDCVETTINWRASIGSDSQFYKGHEYVVTHPNGQVQTLTEGENGFPYYPTTAITRHNTSLALTPCYHFFRGADTVEVISWPS